MCLRDGGATHVESIPCLASIHRSAPLVPVLDDSVGGRRVGTGVTDGRGALKQLSCRCGVVSARSWSGAARWSARRRQPVAGCRSRNAASVVASRLRHGQLVGIGSVGPSARLTSLPGIGRPWSFRPRVGSWWRLLRNTEHPTRSGTHVIDAATRDLRQRAIRPRRTLPDRGAGNRKRADACFAGSRLSATSIRDPSTFHQSRFQYLLAKGADPFGTVDSRLQLHACSRGD